MAGKGGKAGVGGRVKLKGEVERKRGGEGLKRNWARGRRRERGC